MSATDPITNIRALIQCPSVTPNDEGALATLASMLEPLGFEVEIVTFSEEGTPDISNLYARLGTQAPHLVFAGHTDVVPVGDVESWSQPPFSGEIVNGMLYGRGAVDMKGGIACFAAAVARHIENHGNPAGSISFLITGDEEGPAINGTVKLLEWAAEKGEKFDGCIVGEPTNPNALGDMIKIGRRGSLSGTLNVSGVQGHVAYPHLADNPTHSILALANALIDPPFDHGTEEFPPTNLEITSIDTGNPAVNVIPGNVSATFNVRFNDTWSVETLQAEIHNRLDAAAGVSPLRNQRPVDFEIVWRDRPSHVFLTRDEKLTATLAEAISATIGCVPELSTTGGTSDARFIKDYCPVVEFGLVGQTMHMVDERVAVDDLEQLTQVYASFLERWFS